jgi:hypothetical protein
MGVVSYAVLILAYCMTISGMLMTIALSPPTLNKDGTKKQSVFDRLVNAMSGAGKYDNHSMSTLINDFEVDAKDVNDSFLLLSALKKKLRATPTSVFEAASLGTVKACAKFVNEACSDDKRILPALDVVNTILSNPKAALMVRADEGDAKEIVAFLTDAIANHMRPESELKLSGGPKSEIEAKTDKLLSGQADEEDDEDVEFDFSDKVTKRPINEYFYKYGFKIMMALGLLAADSQKVQTMIGDKGAVGLLVSCLFNGAQNVQVVKWVSWAMINLTYEHPPNKREFFIKGGLNHLITGARHHASETDCFQQCVALMLTMLAHDEHTKMNQSAARQSCLANGVFEVLQEGKKGAPDNTELHNMIEQVLKLLISDWS